MKLITYISGALFSSLTIIGIIFKMLHLAGADKAALIGGLGFAIIFIPLFTIYKYRKDK